MLQAQSLAPTMLLPLCSKLSAQPGWGLAESQTLLTWAAHPSLLTGETASQTRLYWLGCSGRGSVF